MLVKVLEEFFHHSKAHSLEIVVIYPCCIFEPSHCFNLSSSLQLRQTEEIIHPGVSVGHIHLRSTLQ